MSSESLLISAYFDHFRLQVKAFEGNWADFDFLTQRTVLPWVGYAAICLFVLPFVANLFFGEKTAVGSKSDGTWNLGNARSMVLVFFVLGALLVPYGFLQVEVSSQVVVASGPVSPGVSSCTEEIRSVCQRIDNGAVPAVVFGTPNVEILDTGIQACVVCGFNSSRMQTLSEGSAKLREIVEKLRREQREKQQQ